MSLHPDKPSTIPAGGHYALGGTGSQYRILLVLPGQTLDTDGLKQVGPTFTSEVEADRYRDWLEGGPAYRYPAGSV